MKKPKAKAGKLAKARAAVEREQKKKAARKPAQIVEHNGLMTLEQAKAHAEQGQEMTERLVNDWWGLALHAREGLEHGGPQALGLSVTAWYQNIFRGTWQMVRRTVEHLKKLKGAPVEELRQIPDANAYALRLLPENLRTTKEWLGKAKTETAEVLTQAIYEKRAEVGIKDEAMVKTSTAFNLNRIPGSLAPLVMDCIKHAAAENDLDLEKKEDRIDAFQVVILHYHQTFCQGQAPETQS